jgi:formylglycine-generating enzyme
MNKKVFSRSLYYALVLLSFSSLTGCKQIKGLFGGGSGQADGDLVGQSKLERPRGYTFSVPYGMAPIPAGTFHMGQTDEDPASTQINYNKQVTIGPFFMDETEISNDEYRQFVTYCLGDKTAREPEFQVPATPTNPGLLAIITEFTTNPAKYLPDTTVWTKDFSHHMGDPLLHEYWDNVAFRDYPVVGVSWEAASFFGKWRTLFLNDFRASDAGGQNPPMPQFRLPSEAEWEYAARGGRDMAKYPWGGPYLRNSKGCMLANFKPGRGNFYDDGYAYTAPVDFYFPNDYMLWNMSGNVSEWCLDDFSKISVPTVWDLNPQFIEPNAYQQERYIDPKSSEERVRLKYDVQGNLLSNPNFNAKKVIRGGSWKDVAFFLETGTRTYEYRDSTRAYIGFRCAMTNLSRSSGTEFNP